MRKTFQFKLYQSNIRSNAQALAETLNNGGLRLVSGGTDNHMVLVDLTSIGINGKDAEISLGKVNIVANRNTIPYDKNPPGTGSGIRLGTPALTSRGMGQKEANQIGELILQTLNNFGNEKISNSVKAEISELAERFPVPGINSP